MITYEITKILLCTETMKGKKKILCLIDILGPGGAQRQIVGLACLTKQAGYDVTVATYYDDRFYVDLLLQAQIPYIYIEKAQKGPFRQLHLMRFIRKVKPDVVISYLESPSVRACVARLFNNSFKLIVSERNTTQHTGRKEKLRFTFFRIADYVVPNAYSQADYINTNFPRLKSKVVTIPNFVDLDYFKPLYKKRRDIPEIIVAASIWPPKNTFGFIDAVAQLKKKGYQFHISWYGKNATHIDYYNKCQEKINKLGIGGYIELKEKTQSILEKYQGTDFFCLPSFYEGTPNVICEAMSCGLPIICSNVCDNAIYVKEDENGFLFNPYCPDEIVTAIQKGLELNDERYRSMCSTSRTIAEQLLSPDVFCKRYIELLES